MVARSGLYIQVPYSADNPVPWFDHSFIWPLLYLSKQSRPYINMGVSFLFTRLIYPGIDGYKKLVRVIKYIQGTIGIPFILSIEKSDNIKWYTDAEFAVHKYMSRHTGSFMTMVTQGAYVQSTKQKLDTKISTEADLVVVENVLTRVIWTQYFLKEQGYEIHDNVIY